MVILLFSLMPNISPEAFAGAFIALSFWTIAHYFVIKAFDSAPGLCSSAVHGHDNGRQDGAPPTSEVISASVQATANIRRPNLSANSLPQVVMTAGLDSISIAVGDKSNLSPYTTSIEQLEYFRGGLKGWPIKIEADHLYGMDGVVLIAKHMALLAKNILPDRWADLTIRFPLAPLARTYVGEIFEPQYLKRLSWTGSRQQLINSWLPVTGKTLYHLTNLILHSDISILDLERLLLASSNLINFELNRVADVEAVLDLPHLTRMEKHKLMSLQSLAISATTDINPLLQNFVFPELTNITLALDYRNPRPHDLPQWNQSTKLKFVTITARSMKPSESKWVKDQCPKDSTHQHWIECSGSA